jgi:asparagine synthase (glutamine-hydrolysing)
VLFYIAAIWNHRDVVQHEEARAIARRIRQNRPEWRHAVDEPGLFVSYGHGTGPDVDGVHPLCGNRGVVLGKLFDSSFGGTPTLDERRSDRILKNPGKELASQYWGQYVAFLRDPDSGDCHVLRDPTAGIVCQRAQFRGIDIYFVRIEDYELLGVESSFQINRHYLVGQLVFNSTCVRETGILGIETVLPGEWIAHRMGQRRHQWFWNPLEIAQQAYDVDRRSAASELRNTVRACVHAWSNSFEGWILHQLSGGLDSSIVAACLSDSAARDRVLCRNFFADDPGCDERRYARDVAELCRLPLIEQPSRSQGTSFSCRESGPRCLLPTEHWMVDAAADHAYEELLRSRRIAVQFTGDGGDELFYTHGPLATAVDRAWMHGAIASVVSTALDDAIADKCSVWPIAKQVWRHGLWKRRWHPRDLVGDQQNQLLRADLKAEAKEDLTLWHPLYQMPSSIPPAKFAHAYVLTFGLINAYVPIEAANLPVIISPLRSQPILELSIRMPVYLLRFGGRDRALARLAFKDDLPRTVALRRTKAYGNAQAETALQQNIRDLRELMLDGYLVREGFLDPTRLGHVLSGDLFAFQSGIVQLSRFIGIELWTQAWRPLSKRKVA